MKDPYRETKRAWDKQYLITVSTHLNVQDRDALKRYCERYNTSPYRLLRSYLKDIVREERLTEARKIVFEEGQRMRIEK